MSGEEAVPLELEALASPAPDDDIVVPAFGPVIPFSVSRIWSIFPPCSLCSASTAAIRSSIGFASPAGGVAPSFGSMPVLSEHVFEPFALARERAVARQVAMLPRMAARQLAAGVAPVDTAGEASGRLRVIGHRGASFFLA